MTIQIVDKVVSAYKRWSHFVLLFQEIQQELQKPSKSAGKREGFPPISLPFRYSLLIYGSSYGYFVFFATFVLCFSSFLFW